MATIIGISEASEAKVQMWDPFYEWYLRESVFGRQ